MIAPTALAKERSTKGESHHAHSRLGHETAQQLSASFGW